MLINCVTISYANKTRNHWLSTNMSIEEMQTWEMQETLDNTIYESTKTNLTIAARQLRSRSDLPLPRLC